MEMTSRGVMKLVVGACGVAALAAAGCGVQAGTEPAAEGGEGLGAVRLALQLSDTVALDHVDYVLTRLSREPAYERSGSIPVADPRATVTAFIDGLPEGPYQLAMSATSVDGAFACHLGLLHPAQHFPGRLAVTVGQTTVFEFILSCSAVAPATGAVALNGSVNVCPQLTVVDVAPLATSVGGTIGVHAEATDLDPGTELTYRWSALVDNAGTDAGQFADNTAATTSFTCLQEATMDLYVTASDGHCRAFSRVPVACVAPSPGT